MKTFTLLPLALLAMPAVAQDYPPPAPPPPYDDASRAPDRGPIDPSTARQVMGAVQAVTDAMLDVRIDGIRRAADPRARDGDGAQTIGDLMARRDPAYRDHIRQDMARAARTAVAAGRTATAVQAAADDFARRIEHALNGVDGY